jgi:hypothetical protein
MRRTFRSSVLGVAADATPLAKGATNAPLIAMTAHATFVNNHFVGFIRTPRFVEPNMGYVLRRY